MADLSDVEQAFANTVTSILYPGGVTGLSIVGSLCRVYRGWPNPATLNADLNANAVNVTIDAVNDSGNTTTRYLPKWVSNVAIPGVSATTTASSITILGNPANGDLVGTVVDGIAFAYRVKPGDTPFLVASNLNALIQSTRISTVEGNTITVPGARSIVARVVCDGIASFESRRQEKDLRITCWCSSPLTRDAVAAAIDSAFTTINFLSLLDKTRARVVYKTTTSYDQSQNALLYRRDLVYTVEYATVSCALQPAMLFGAVDLNENTIYG